jgi:hypothetical protein
MRAAFDGAFVIKRTDFGVVANVIQITFHLVASGGK